MLALILTACRGDVVAPFQPTTGAGAAGLYWALTVDHRAVTLSTVPPYDTTRLTATPRDWHGAPVTGLDAATFRSTVPERLRVTPDGLVQALDVGTDMPVVVELAAGSARHVDTVLVTITNDPAPPILDTLSIHPQPPDSSVLMMNGQGSRLLLGYGAVAFYLGSFQAFTARLTDSEGNSLSGISVAYTTSDTLTLWVDRSSGNAIAKRPGRVNLMASATAYGVTKADTVTYTVIMPGFAVVWIRPHATGLGGGTQTVFAGSEVTLSPGGTVLWGNVTGQPVDIVFDDPTNVVEHGAANCDYFAISTGDVGGGGDIQGFGEAQDPTAFLSVANCRSRRFPVPGVYPYHSTLTGATGKVIVSDGLSTP
jgi:hypothetical protein